MKKIYQSLYIGLSISLLGINATDQQEIRAMAKKYVVLKKLKQNALNNELITAARMRKEATFFVDLVINQKADINAIDLQGKTALIHAVIADDNATVEILLNLRAKIFIKDSFGKDALTYAYEIHNETIINLLKVFATKEIQKNI